MKILVTGAAGFIGYHLVKNLQSYGFEVVGIDNINDYYDLNYKYARLQECGINKDDALTGYKVRSIVYPNFYFRKMDIIENDSLSELFQNEKFDIVVNMAAQAGVRYSLQNPGAYISSNIVGFGNLLEACRHSKIKHFIYASSSSVYGMIEKVPFSEEDRVDFPVSLYAATKKSNELLAHSYSHLYQLPTTGLRFFTVYGPYGRPDMSPMLFADAIYAGKPIKVFNGGDMQRDFTFIDDIAESLIRLLNCAPGKEEERPYYRILNIGNSTPINLMDFIGIMQNTIGIQAKLEMYPMQDGDVKITYADTRKLNELIDYKPQTLLKDGVASFINWYRFYNNL